MLLKKYPNFHSSNNQWIDKIPSHWKLSRLKYIAKIHPSNVDKKTIEGELPILLCNYMDVYKNEFIDDSINFMEATATLTEINKFRLMKGDVLATKDSETPDDIANSAFVVKNFKNVICAYHLTQIRSNRLILMGEYLHRLFQENKFKRQFQVAANGITRYGLSVSAFTDSLIPLPPIEEQVSIANYLDQKTTLIDKLISNKQKLIELLDEEKNSLIKDAVSGIGKNWSRTKLKYIAKIILGKMLTSEDNGGLTLKPYLRAANMKWLSVDISTVKEMWFSNKELEKLRVKNNDLLVSEGGEVGRTCIWQNELVECYIQNSVHKITMNDDQNPRFYLYQFFYMGHIGFFESIVNRISIGHLTGEKLNDVVVYNPPLKEQNNLVKKIIDETKRIDTIITKIEKEISLMQEYRTALISEVVTGKMDVRNYKEQINEPLQIAAEP